MEVHERCMDVYLTESHSCGFSEMTVGSSSGRMFTYGVILSRHSHGGFLLVVGLFLSLSLIISLVPQLLRTNWAA
jgi:hypothetical protein